MLQGQHFYNKWQNDCATVLTQMQVKLLSAITLRRTHKTISLGAQCQKEHHFPTNTLNLIIDLISLLLWLLGSTEAYFSRSSVIT